MSWPDNATSSKTSTTFIIGLPKEDATISEMIDYLGDCGVTYRQYNVYNKTYTNITKDSNIISSRVLKDVIDTGGPMSVNEMVLELAFNHLPEVEKNDNDGFDKWARVSYLATQEAAAELEEFLNENKNLKFFKITYSAKNDESYLEQGDIFRNIPHKIIPKG